MSDGPYKYGDTPPEDLMGWAGPELAREAYDGMVDEADSPFVTYEQWRASFADDVDSPTGTFIWQHARDADGGSLPPCEDQETGDCVGAGAAAAICYRLRYEIAGLYEEEIVRRAHMSFIYAVSRMAPDCGNGRLGRQAGSTGAWAARAMERYGVLFLEDAGVPPYSGALSDKWGYQDAPAEMYELAKDNLVGKCARLETVEQIRHELINHRPVTIASGRGFQMQPARISKAGRDWHVFKPSGSWAHQMVWLDWTDDLPAAYRMNSWGPDAHGTPLGVEPSGGAWNMADDIERELSRYDVECFSVSLFQGEPGPADWRILHSGRAG